jgi:hypothetical protein
MEPAPIKYHERQLIHRRLLGNELGDTRGFFKLGGLFAFRDGLYRGGDFRRFDPGFFTG